MIRRDPVGVVASIAPWNYPMYMAAWKLGPALATGNTVVLKPSARTPLTALTFADIARRGPAAGRAQRAAGSGADMGDLLVGHPKVRMISITGDTVTGKHIAKIAADTVKRLHLELGGKAPVIIFDDADLDLAAEIVKSAGYWNAGQDCTAACRVIAGPKVYDAFVDKLADQVRSIKWGDPAEADDLDMGSLIAQAQADKVEGMVGRALEAPGVQLVVGGSRPSAPAPTSSRPSSRDRTSAARSSRTRSSGRSSPSSASPTRRRPSAGRTTSGSACRRRSSPATSVGRCASPRRSSSAPSGSTSTSRWRPRRRTAASRSRATARTARSTHSRTTRSSST